MRFRIAEKQLISSIASEHNEQDFEYWSAFFDTYTTFKTVHLFYVMQYAKILEAE